MNKPLVSVILPVYNGGVYLRESINSIVNQIYTNLEIIIIDDGSTDDSAIIIADYAADSRIVFISRENRGLVETLNEGIAIAKGTYIARMDADDISDKHRIYKQVLFFENNLDVAVVGCRVENISIDGMHISYCHRPLLESHISTYLLYGSPLAHPTVMFNLNVMHKNDILYKSDSFPAEDFDLWLRLSKKYKIRNIPDVLLKYRINLAGVSSNNTTKQAETSYKLRIAHFCDSSDICSFIKHIETYSGNHLCYVIKMIWKVIPLLKCNGISGIYLMNIFLRVIRRRVRIGK